MNNSVRFVATVTHSIVAPGACPNIIHAVVASMSVAFVATTEKQLKTSSNAGAARTSFATATLVIVNLTNVRNGAVGAEGGGTKVTTHTDFLRGRAAHPADVLAQSKAARQVVAFQSPESTALLQLPCARMACSETTQLTVWRGGAKPGAYAVIPGPERPGFASRIVPRT